MYGWRGKIGLLVPANNSVIEPELGGVLPDGVALYATRMLTRGDLTEEAIRAMEPQADRGVEELVASGVDLIAFADMATTLVMPRDWNERRTEEVARRTGCHCITAAGALWAALGALGRRAVSIATPYPRRLHDLVAPFFEALGYKVVSHDTADILAMAEVPRRPPQEAYRLARSICRAETEALVILATDFRTFEVLEDLENDTGRPAVSSNQALLWHALRTLRVGDRLPGLGTLLRSH
jgi:maleate cis-trans isomerase